jgi:gentisate 1,2-dioxygenase
MNDSTTDKAERSLPVGAAGPILRYQDYLASVRRQPDRPAAWTWTEIAKALGSSEDGERGKVVALATGQRSAQGEVAPGLSLVAQEIPPSRQTSKHRHSFWHIYWVGSGHGTAIIENDNEERPLAPADIVFIPPWHAHWFRNDSAVEPLILFALQNAPQMVSLGCHMRETEDGSRVSVFSEATE